VASFKVFDEFYPLPYFGIIKEVLELLHLLFKDLFSFLGKSDVQKRGETERKIFHPMIHSPSDHNGQ